MATRIPNLQITQVVDGDTVKVALNGKTESLRLICVDTEESYSNTSKPVTAAGKAASEMAKKYFATADGKLPLIDIEFDTDDPVEIALSKHRDNYGRLLCYVHKDGENYNLKLIKEGWSPYFMKYGRSRLYHRQMTEAESAAKAYNLMIWNPITNAKIPSRNYANLLPWWSMRGSIVEEFRLSEARGGALSVRLHYPKILAASEKAKSITIFCDLQAGINKWIGGNALIYAGSVYHKLDLWIPDAETYEMAPLKRLIEKRYAGQGRGYVYISGQVEQYKSKPQIILKNIKQLSDFPPES
ncbi:MAG: thermonuclease family protein [Microcoleus sp. PH2017_10_PVI_O_A]|uniref:thermonuclease family protein n=1 Tax=unclassified Microcoleus TaxID=2642155 RepID=UPI001D701725|nr:MULTISPECIES: thermonuclease family protein [unclassified Microcoleus]TAE76223.1 MAG: thermonuclease family protein [Oscillatoriales cyanobacterium]MCC3408300.1 thermonuclease family protein [Microcoleus sp. PH2017_10_PVI_O_A]MCC3461628.1 thermonuclease family protein [Microcoleus sp. PH2017_11_PCY_U_A]MCC3480861.1 thermonuclease family protein [Microcoleus sp. PH2017_12_PCY_D_A]MCC3530768.1 thermonuclease family protein [Microcoleus sp. PH2017_21_RUC_O_A]